MFYLLTTSGMIYAYLCILELNIVYANDNTEGLLWLYISSSLVSPSLLPREGEKECIGALLVCGENKLFIY
jgi:hypothetical protein